MKNNNFRRRPKQESKKEPSKSQGKTGEINKKEWMILCCFKYCKMNCTKNYSFASSSFRGFSFMLLLHRCCMHCLPDCAVYKIGKSVLKALLIRRGNRNIDQKRQTTRKPAGYKPFEPA